MSALILAMGCLVFAGTIVARHLQAEPTLTTGQVDESQPSTSPHPAAQGASHDHGEHRPAARLAEGGEQEVVARSATADRSADGSQNLRHLAVVFVNPDAELAQAAEAQLLADLPGLGVSLVERKQIDEVLAEQALSLSAMADRDHAVQVGQLVGADGLLIVQRLEHEQSAFALRAVATTTGVVLAEELVVTKEPELISQVARAVVEQAVAKLRVPPEDRVYVAVLAFQPEARAQELNRLTEAIQPMLRVALQAYPQVVVLERQELRRLVHEHALAGVPLEFQGTGLLVEGGLGTADDLTRVEVAVKLSAPIGGQPISTRMQAPADPSRIGEAILRWIEAEGLQTVEGQTFSRQAEAHRLLKRADWLNFTSRSVAHVHASIEAAVALDPSLATLRGASREFNRTTTSSRELSEGFTPIERAQNDLRLAELVHRTLRLVSASSDPEAIEFISPYRVIVLRTSLHDDLARSEEGRRLFQRALDLEIVNLDLAIQILHSRNQSAVELLVAYVSLLNYPYEDDPAKYCRTMISILERLKQEQADYPQEWSNGRALPGLEMVSGLSYRIGDEFTLDEMRPLLNWCLKHGHPYLRLSALQSIAKHGREAEAINAAREILDLVFDDDPSDDEPWRSMRADSLDGNVPFADPTYMAIDRLDMVGQLRPWLEQTLGRAEANSNPTALRRYPIAFCMLLNRVEDAGSLTLTTRALKLAEASQPQAHQPRVVDEYAVIVRRLNERVREVHLARGEPMDDDPWQQVMLEPVRFENQTPELVWPVQYYLEPESDEAAARNLLITWNSTPTVSKIRKGDLLTVTRSSREGGPLEIIAQAVATEDFRFHTPTHESLTGSVVRQLGGRVFFATDEGLLVIENGQADMHGSAIRAVEVVNERVFVLDDGLALFEFDTVTKHLDPIASRQSVVPRNALDGEHRRIMYILADPAQGWLYLLCDTDEAPGGASIWRMNPDTREVVHINKGRIAWNAPLYWYRDRVLLAPPRWQIDRAQGQMTASEFWPDDWPAAWQQTEAAVQRMARIGPYQYHPGLHGRDPALHVDGAQHKTNQLTRSSALWRDAEYGVWCAFLARLPDDSGPAIYRIVPKLDEVIPEDHE